MRNCAAVAGAVSGAWACLVPDHAAGVRAAAQVSRTEAPIRGSHRPARMRPCENASGVGRIRAKHALTVQSMSSTRQVPAGKCLTAWAEGPPRTGLPQGRWSGSVPSSAVPVAGLL